VIIAPYYNRTTGHLSASVTSDLWSAANGTATFSWMSWSGAKLATETPQEVQFQIGAINSTEVLATNLNKILKGHKKNDAVLRMQVQASAPLPNSDRITTFRHENWFSASPLNRAKLSDPGLELSYSDDRETFSVTAMTGVAARVWLDYPAGAVVSFDSNGFWLAKGESREVGFKVKNDTTNGSWRDGVKVWSMWDQTTPD
jgi:beta-mannosidase